MSRASRFVIGSGLALAAAASLVAFADPALAQPGKDKGKEFGKDFGKGFEKKGPDKKGEPGIGDAVRTLEAELAKLKALEKDLEGKLKQLKDSPRGPKGPDVKGPPAKEPEGRKGPEGFGRGPGGFGPPGMPGFGRGAGGFGPPGGFGRGPGGPGGSVDGIVRMAGGLSAEQLRELIGALDKLRAEKQKATAPAPRPKGGERPEARPGERPKGGPEGRPGGGQEEILRKLEQLTREIEEIRRAIRR